MKELNIEKISEDNYKININQYFSINFTKEELYDLNTKLNEFIEKNSKPRSYTLKWNKKSERLERVYEDDYEDD